MKDFLKEILSATLEMSCLVFISSSLMFSLFTGILTYKTGYRDCKKDIARSTKKYNMCISICKIDHPKYNKEQCDYICKEEV